VATWGEILAEVQQSRSERGGQADFDGIRRRYLRELYELTGRATILYSTDWLSGPQPNVSIVLEDMQGMMEACKGLPGPDLDVILHSPGGSPDATASIVRYLRRKYSSIRVFVPVAAMSAATMWALAANEIWMGKHSQLGPIDPQMVIGNQQYPARAILEQFERAKRELKADASLLPAWIPILQAYGPSLLEQCEQAEKLAQRLVRDWLRRYMLPSGRYRARNAARIAKYFADYARHQSHGMGIGRDEAERIGVTVKELETDQRLQDAVLSVHHAVAHTFTGTAAVKIIENHHGRAFIKIAQAQTISLPIQLAPVPQPAVAPPPGP
jgi:hypothetical protein